MGILNSFDLNGKVALVTGANRGLGLAMATGLAEAGADIVCLNRGDATEIRQKVEGAEKRFYHVQCDLLTASVEELQGIVKQTAVDMGQLDILVNNAGIIRRSTAIQFQENDWDAVLQVNLKAMFFLAQAAASVMLKQRKGKIIQVASVLSHQGGITVASYTAAKHGTLGITRALANEWAKYSINVNAIVPGYFHTDVTTAIRQDTERYQSILSRIPAGRWGEPDDLKGAAVFLASDASNYMHGATIAIDGGWLAR